jgi:hypothetical protein
MAIATVAAITAGQRVCAHAAIIPCFGVFWCQMHGELQLSLSCLKLWETKMAQSATSASHYVLQIVGSFCCSHDLSGGFIAKCAFTTLILTLNLL